MSIQLARAAKVTIAAVTAVAATLAATPTAEARTIATPHHIPMHAKDGPNIYRGSFVYRWNVRPQPGRDAMWVKPVAVELGYHTMHLVRHWSYNCTFAGDMSYYVFRVYVFNTETGYNHRQTFKLDCDGSRNSDMRGLTHFPRCYMPFIVDSEGRGGQKGHRPVCKLRVTAEGVRLGPDPNTHTIIAAAHKIHPALYGSS